MGLGLASASLICKAMKGELNLIRSEKYAINICL